MTRAIVTVGACAALLCAGPALAAPTAQQKCDFARVKAWRVYQSCVNNVVAKDAKGIVFDEFAAFAKCRYPFFKKWTRFQTNNSLSGSSCQGNRFVDNGDGSETDNLTGLVWEKKTDDSSINDKDNFYSWSTGSNDPDGTAFTDFLTGAGTGLNVAGFAGANGWRLPTLTELQTIVLNFHCSGPGNTANCLCPSSPCVDPNLDAATTQSGFYWTDTSDLPIPSDAWRVNFANGEVSDLTAKVGNAFVRAVRGGF
jgi:hypothetical protein